MKHKFLLCLTLVLSGCATNKPANLTLHATSPNAAQRNERSSPWGRMENGLRCRVTLPEAIEQGMSVPATVELQDDPAKLPQGVRKLNTLMHDVYFTLTLTDPKTGKRFEIKPFGFAGPPIPFTGTDLVALDGRPLRLWTIHFPLVREYTNLASADYACQVAFSYSNCPSRWDQGGKFNPASWWKGTIVSGTVHLRVLPETPKFRVFYIPKRLVVTKELTNPLDHPAKLVAIPAIRFFKADFQTVRLRVRNGHSLYTWIDYQGTLGKPGGMSGDFVPVPNDPNLHYIGECPGYKGQDVRMVYRIKVCEWVNDGFKFGPGPGSPGYRMLWSRNYHVSFTGKEFQELPVTDLKVPAGTDNRDCVTLIRNNPEVEVLSLRNTGITDAGLASVGRLKHLGKLYLDDTHITDLGLVHLQHLTHLKTLYLDGTKVTDAGLLRLRRLTRLENLSLSNTAISDKGAAVVSEFRHLKLLDLINTRIGDATMARLRDLKQLNWLFLTGTRATDKGVETVKLALPNCSVEVE